MKITTEKMKLLFWFRKSTIPDWGTIMLRVKIPDAKNYEFQTDIKIRRDEWNGNELRVKLLKQYHLSESAEQLKEKSRSINNELSEIEESIKFVQEVLFILSYSEVTATKIGELYKFLSKNNLEPTRSNIEKILKPEPVVEYVEPERVYTLLEILDKFLEKKKTEVNYTTFATYEYRYIGIEKYLHVISKPFFPANNFDAQELDRFCEYLKSKRIGKNRINRYTLLIKDAFRFAYVNKQAKPSNIVFYVFKKETKEDLRHLEFEHLNLLIELEIEKYVNPCYENVEILNDARNQFIMLCFTGLHLCDYLKLTDENLVEVDGNSFLISDRQKTGREFNIKLHPTALFLIEFYGGINQLPRIKKDPFNAILKRIELMLGLKKKIGLSSKIGRKTLAHVALNEWGIDADTLARFMGLKNARYITAYGQVERKRVNMKINFVNEIEKSKAA